MADVIVTFKIMPESPDADLKEIEEKASQLIKEFGGEIGKTEQEPVAFGLKSLNLLFVLDEAKGTTDSLEEDISKLKGVNSCEVTDVRRAVG